MDALAEPKVRPWAPGRWTRFAWLPIPLLMAAMAGLWVAGLRTVWHAPFLFWLSDTGSAVFAIVFIVAPAARQFVARGQLSVLLLGCGVLVVQLGVFVGAIGLRQSLNAGFAIFTLSALLSALCHFAGVTFCSRPGIHIAHPAPWLAGAYAGCTAVMGLIVWAALASWAPDFFSGVMGVTLLRSLVEGAATVLFTLTACLLWMAHRRSPSPFFHWYALGLGLLATSLVGHMLIAVGNSPLQWVARFTQAFGTLYMCVAVLIRSQEWTAGSIPMEGMEGIWQEPAFLANLRRNSALGLVLRYLLAVAGVAAALGAHLAFTSTFGPGLPPYVLFYPVVIMAAVLGGIGPGVLATLLASLTVGHWVLPPIRHFAGASAMDRLGLAIFFTMGTALSLGAELLRRYRDKAAAYDRQKIVADTIGELQEAQRLTHIGSWQWDARSDATTSSEQLYHLYGIDPAVETFPDFGKQRGRCYPIQDWERVNAAVQNTLQTGIGYELDVNVNSDHGLIWVTTRGEPVRDAAGRIVGLRGTVQDITARKRLEEALQQSERLYRTIGESIDHGIWVCAPDGRNTYASESFLKLVGLTQEQYSSLGWGTVLHPDDRERTLAAWQECVRTGGAWDMEQRFRGVDGQWHHVLARGLPVRNESGQITCWAGINLEIDRLKQMEKGLQEEAARKDEFLALLGHELRNPLVPIGNAVYLVRKAGQDQALVETACAIVEHQLAHIVRLVDDLLDVSRIARGKIQLKNEVFDLVELVRGVVQDYQPVLAENGLSLQTSLAAGPVLLDGDRTRMLQTVSNLFHNACKFTDPGGEVRVAVSQQERDWAQVTVQDTGVGIPADSLSSIFEPFMQRKETIGRSRGGLGLGLALSKGLVELHGGTLSARSGGPGKGSEFTIRLPAARAGDRPGRQVPWTGAAEAAHGRRILVVEDLPDAATTLRLVLEMAGHTVAVAQDGRAALEQAGSFQPEIILCDIGLPGDLDGYGVARSIRGTPALAAVHLVAMTGFGSAGAKEEALRAGFAAHLTKPVSPEALQELIAGLPNPRTAGTPG
jgi:PAS domain S-box-containing protein